MYTNAAAVSRPEINVFLEEARDLEKLFIAEKVAPVHTVNARAGRYPRIRIEKGELMKHQVTKRGPDGTYNEVARKLEWDTYDCEDRGLEERIDDANATEMKSFFDMETTTGKLITRNMKIDHEVEVANMIFDTNTFTSTNSAVAYTEGNIDTIDVARDINDAIDRLTDVAVVPNTLIMNQTVWNRIRRSKKLQTYFFGPVADVGNRLVTPQNISDVFNIPNVLVARASYDSAKKGATKSISKIWNNNYMWLGDVQGGDFQNGGAARTLVWGADAPGGLYTTETWREEKRRSDMMRVRSHQDYKVVNELCGQLIATQWA